MNAFLDFLEEHEEPIASPAPRYEHAALVIPDPGTTSVAHAPTVAVAVASTVPGLPDSGAPAATLVATRRTRRIKKGQTGGTPKWQRHLPKHLRNNLLAHRLNHAKRKKRLATQAKEFRELLTQLRPTQRWNTWS